MSATNDDLFQRPNGTPVVIKGDPLRFVEIELTKQLRYDLETFSNDHNRLLLVRGPMAVMLAQVRLALAAERSNDLKEGV